MVDSKKYTAFCGLYCLDCIPSNKHLFSILEEVENTLTTLQFEKYAELKSRSSEVFRKYPDFVGILQEIRKLECPAPCRAGGGKPGCKVRECAVKNRLEGCWECRNYKHCELLDPLKKVHPNLEYHLELIRDNGVEHWSSDRKEHYSWG